tara:strand:+ start:341 stop:1051 length:711 start_codon:yes stop_codon:yes gene_type:complete
MGWTTPNTYATNDIITASLFNTDIRDNLNNLSTHAHGGAAGAGNDEITGVDYIEFDNIGTPSSNRIGRNGSDLYWGSTKLSSAGPSDTVGETVSLGAADGTTASAVASEPVDTDLTQFNNTTTTLRSLTRSGSLSTTTVTFAIFGFGAGKDYPDAAKGAIVTLALFVDSSSKATRTYGVSNTNTGSMNRWGGGCIYHGEDGLDNSSHTVELKATCSVSQNLRHFAEGLVVIEVKSG